MLPLRNGSTGQYDLLCVKYTVVDIPGYYTLNAFVYGICQIPRILQKGGKLVFETTNCMKVFNELHNGLLCDGG